jgi:hypothetical protein
MPRTLNPGYNRSRVIAFSTLDKLLRRGNGHPDWRIEAGCVNLWGELTSAVFARGTAAKELSEDIDDSCPDHALTAAYYGLHDHLISATSARNGVVAGEEARQRRREEQDLRKLARAMRL